jgi:hypothetical protein
VQRGRSIAAGIVGVIAILGVVGATFALWARAVVFDSDRFAAVVEDAIAQPEVIEAVARNVTELAFTAAEIDARLEGVLPPALQPLRPAVVGGARAFVQERLERRLATDGSRELITGVVRRAHVAAVDLLRGDGLVDGVTVIDGAISVNLLPLLGRGFEAVQGIGLLDDLDVPPLTVDGDPDEQIAALEATFDRDLPPDFGQLVVYRSDAIADAQASLATAQQALVLAKRALWALLAVTAGLLVASVALARSRRRAALALALGSIGAVLVLRVVVQRVVDDAPAMVVDVAARALVTGTLDGLTSGLYRMLTVLMLIAVVVALVAFLAGPSPMAQSVRGGAAASSSSIVARHRDAVAIVAFALSVGALLVLGLGLGAVVLAVLLAGAGIIVLTRPA